jgi:hypothetical protein
MMNAQSSAPIKMLCWSVLMLGLPGCSRSAVVMLPENTSSTYEATSQKTVARAQSDDSETASFAFPEDAGGALLAKVLPPKDVEWTQLERSGMPRLSSASAFMKPPALSLPPSHAVLPRLPDEARPSRLHPPPVLDETLVSLPDTPALPEPPSLPDRGRVRVPSIDVNEPIPLPILARPVSDRASLDDPTLDASATAATAAPIPLRTSKAPFLKLTLPDPYDRRRTDVPAPEESKEFPVGSPQMPRR